MSRSAFEMRRSDRVHFGGVDMAALRRQRRMERPGEAPGRTALAADEQDRVGRLRRRVRGQSGPCAAPFQPHHEAGRAERRRGRGAEPERQRQNPGAPPGMEEMRPFADPLDHGRRREGQRRAGGRIDERFALRRAQAKHAGGVATGREGQLLEVGDIGSGERREAADRRDRPAARGDSPAARTPGSG